MVKLKFLSGLSATSTRIQTEPSLQEIADPWNNNVETRALELESGIDDTYFNVIVPTVKELLNKYVSNNKAKVIDVGCGLGYLTERLACWGYDVVGIDIAEKVINLAKKRFPEIDFELASLQDYALHHTDVFDACLINMTLHNLGDTHRNIEAIHRMLKNDGIVVASVPHPKNWFKTRSYFEKFALFYDYKKERKYQVPFKIRRGEIHPSQFHYFHRPISFYENEIIHAGFEILFSDNPKKPNGEFEEDLLFCVWKKV